MLNWKRIEFLHSHAFSHRCISTTLRLLPTFIPLALTPPHINCCNDVNVMLNAASVCWLHLPYLVCVDDNDNHSPITTPSTLGPNALPNSGWRIGVDINASNERSRKHFNRCECGKSGEQFTWCDTIAAYLAGSLTNDHGDNPEPDNSIARWNSEPETRMRTEWQSEYGNGNIFSLLLSCRERAKMFEIGIDSVDS